MRNQQELERLLDEALEQAVRRADWAPDPRSSWMKVQRKIDRIERRRRWLKLLPFMTQSPIGRRG